MSNLFQSVMSHSSTFQSLSALRNDAIQLKGFLSQGYQSTAMKVDQISRTNPSVKHLLDWFRQKTNLDIPSALEDTDDEFSSDIQSDKAPKIMDAKSMKKLESAKVQEMFRIGEQKVKAKIQNSAEIIRTIDSRSAEIVTSLSTTHSILSSISSRLDQIIALNSSDLEKQKRQRLTMFNDDAILTIDSFYKYIYKTMISSTSDVIDIVMDKTGLKELDNSINDIIQNVQTKLSTSFLKLPIIKNLINTRGEKNKDYSRYIDAKQYTRDPAIFDKITRKSITNIIPTYLRLITQRVTTLDIRVNSHGELTADSQTNFSGLIHNTFETGDPRDMMYNSISTQLHDRKKEFTEADVKEMQRIMVSQYVYYMYNHGIKNISSDLFANGGIVGLCQHVISLMMNSNKKNFRYWNDIMTAIRTQLQLNPKFREYLAITINRIMEELDRNAENYAINSDGTEHLQFSQEMFDAVAKARIKHGSEKFVYDGKTLKELVDSGVISRASLTADQLKKYNEPIRSFNDLEEKLRRAEFESTESLLMKTVDMKTAWAEDIFTRLNTGINVKIVKTKFKKQQMMSAGLSNGIFTGTPSRPKDVETLMDSVPMKKEPPPAPAKEPFRIKNIPKKIGSKIAKFFKKRYFGKDDMEGVSDDEIEREVLAELNTAVIDGEISSADSASLRNRASQIKDPYTRQKVLSALEGVRTRFSSDDIIVTMIMKSIPILFSGAVSFINKTLSTAKSFYTKTFKKFFKFATKSLKTAFGNIGSGMKSIGSGSKGLFTNLFKNKARTGNQRLGIKISTADKRLKSWYANLYGEDENKRKAESRTETPEEPKANDPFAQPTQPPKPLQQPETQLPSGKKSKKRFSGFSKLGKKFGKSELAKGFKDARAKRKQFLATSLADTQTGAIFKFLTGTSKNTVSVFDAICGTLSSIQKSIDKWLDKIYNGIKNRIGRVIERRNQRLEKKKEPSNENKKHGIGYDIGHMLSGMADVLDGIMQAIMTVAATLAGAKLLMKLMHSILEKSLKPLNKSFRSLVRILRPLASTVTKVLKGIVESVVKYVEALFTIINPIMEIIDTVLEQIMSALDPILDMITELVTQILVPLAGFVFNRIVPTLTIIAGTIQVQAGILQVGFGLVLAALGGILVGIGAIGKLFGAGSLYDSGKQMWDVGTSLVVSGGSNIVSGFKRAATGLFYIAQDWSVIDTPVASVSSREKLREYGQEEIIGGSPMDGIYGSGDIGSYEFSPDVQDAMDRLKDIVSSITTIFTGDNSVDASMKKANEKAAYEQAQLNASNLSDEEKNEIDTQAFELFKGEHPKYEGESDKDYQNRYERSKAKYWTLAATNAVKKAVEGTAGGSTNNAYTLIDKTLGDSGFMSGFTDAMKDYDSETVQGSATTALMDYSNMRNMGASYAYYEGGYDKEDLIKQIAMIYEGYLKVNTTGRPVKDGGTYFNTLYSKPITLRDGTTRKIRPDCSGIVSAGIQQLGYRLKEGSVYADDGGVKSYVFARGTKTPFIYDKDGNVSQDWIYLPFSDSALQRGDITAGWWGDHGHVSLPIINLNSGSPKGLDGGGNSNIHQSRDAAVAYLDGADNIPWRSAMGSKWSSGSPSTIIRFVGKPVTQHTASNTANANMADKEIWNYLRRNIGMSEYGTAGMMGIMKAESGMKSNNLEDIYNSGKYFNMTDEQYTQAVNSGKESEQQFVTGRNYTAYKSQTPGEAVGYGLAQFTSSSLKKDLYNRTVKQNKSIADAPSQLDMLSSQLKKMKWDGKSSRGGSGQSLFNWINNAKSVDEARQYFLWRYTAGTIYTSDAGVANAYGWSGGANSKAIQTRKKAAQDVYNQFHGSGDESVMIPEQQSIIVNQIQVSSFNLSEYIDSIFTNSFDIESVSIQTLMSSIFEELPDYLDDEDEYDEEDFAMLQQLQMILQ